MKVIIANAGSLNREYKKVVKNFNWDNIIQGDILHISTMSNLPIGDAIVRLKTKNAVLIEVIDEIKDCKCRHCYELAELV